MKRVDATRLLAERLVDQVVVSNLGQATLELQMVGDRALNVYTFGSMGQCSSMGLGIALARPDVKVVCLDGDGSLLMNLGVLCTIANEAPPNLSVVIWDNESHQTTGGQATATRFRTSLAGLAKGAGIEKIIEPANEEDLDRAFDRILSEDGPFVVPVKVDRGFAEGKMDRNMIAHKIRFMNAMKELSPSR